MIKCSYFIDAAAFLVATTSLKKQEPFQLLADITGVMAVCKVPGQIGNF